MSFNFCAGAGRGVLGTMHGVRGAGHVTQRMGCRASNVRDAWYVVWDARLTLDSQTLRQNYLYVKIIYKCCVFLYDNNKKALV